MFAQFRGEIACFLVSARFYFNGLFVQSMSAQNLLQTTQHKKTNVSMYIVDNY